MQSLATGVFRCMALLVLLAAVGALFLIGPGPLLQWWQTINGIPAQSEMADTFSPLVDRGSACLARRSTTSDTFAGGAAIVAIPQPPLPPEPPTTIVPLPPAVQNIGDSSIPPRSAASRIPRPIFWASLDGTPSRLPAVTPLPRPLPMDAVPNTAARATAATYVVPSRVSAAGAGPGNDTAGTASLQRAQQRLKQLGAVSYRLETWGVAGRQFRFQCQLAIPGNPRFSRQFEAIDDDAITAMHRVIQQIETWLRHASN